MLLSFRYHNQVETINLHKQQGLKFWSMICGLHCSWAHEGTTGRGSYGSQNKIPHSRGVNMGLGGGSPFGAPPTHRERP